MTESAAHLPVRWGGSKTTQVVTGDVELTQKLDARPCNQFAGLSKT